MGDACVSQALGGLEWNHLVSVSILANHLITVYFLASVYLA